jgi:uncharacterized protein with GYD domain
MAGYIMLGRYTPEGLAKIKEMPEIINKHKEKLKESGIRLVGTWLTMGEYDFVSIYECPDDLTMAVRILDAGRAGLVTTQTMRALSEAEFAQVVSKIE